MDLDMINETEAWMFLEAEITEELEKELGREPTEEEIQKEMNELGPDYDISEDVRRFQEEGLLYSHYE